MRNRRETQILFCALIAPCALTGLEGGFLNINKGFGFLPPCQTGHPQAERQNTFLAANWQKWRLVTRTLACAHCLYVLSGRPETNCWQNGVQPYVKLFFCGIDKEIL
jgi:hypothetical protein